VVDLSKLDPATMARHLGKPEGEIGRVLADSMAERNWPVYEAGFQRLAVQPGDRLFEVGFGNGKLVPRLLARDRSPMPASISPRRWSAKQRLSTRN